MKILAIVADGFEELEALGSIALLKRSGIDVVIATMDKQEVKGKHGITITHLNDVNQLFMDDFDCLFIPGGPHYQTLEKSEIVKQLIADCFQQNKWMAAICAAPTILGRLGYLKNRKYTCFTSMNEDFRGIYLDQYVVVDDHLITARSAAASIDFAFAIIKALQGETQEALIKAQIYY